MKLIFQLFLFSLLLLQYTHTSAQCAMCKATAESSVAEASKAATGLNIGIAYLFLMPYLLVAVIGYIWYTKYYKPTKK